MAISGRNILPKFQEYIICALLQLFLPLLPILLEKWFTSSISIQSLMLSASIYSISVGSSSRYKLTFIVSIFISIIFAACYGISVANIEMIPTNGYNFALYSIVFLVFISLLERYVSYVIDTMTCWKFK